MEGNWQEDRGTGMGWLREGNKKARIGREEFKIVCDSIL